MRSELPLGILGGTFDPVHFGHLRLAEEARQALALGSVLWVPAGRPPHRQPPVASPSHRLAMVASAVADHPAFAVDDTEVRAESPSYTVLSLERLRASHGDQPLVLILGMDAFLGLASWKRWRELFDLAHIGVATRPGYALAPGAMAAELAAEYQSRLAPGAEALAAKPAGSIVRFDMTPLAISATHIRALIAGERSARYLLPDPVLAYISSHFLYR